MNRKYTQVALTAAFILGVFAAVPAEEDIFDENADIQNPKKMIKEKAGEHLHTAGQVVGSHLYSTGGETLGKIEEIVLTPDLQEISYAVLARGGFLGFGEKHIALPFDIIEADAKKHRLQADLSEDLLERAPEFSAETAEQERLQLKMAYNFYTKNADVDTEWQPDKMKPAGRILPDDRKLTRLSGTRVYNSNGASIGTLEVATINLNYRKLTFAIIDGADIESLKEKTLVVPWGALSVSKTGSLEIDAEMSQLESVAFKKDKVPSLGDLRIGEQIYSRFGQDPFWPEDETESAWYGGWYYGYWPYGGAPGGLYY